MDEERMRWITKRPTLDGWQITCSYAETPDGTYATVWASGTCTRKRGALWTHSETFKVGTGRYSATDFVTHLSMVCDQDRPTTNEALTRSLCGEAWEQPELPW